MKRLIGGIALGAAVLLAMNGTIRPASAQTMNDLKTCQNVKGDPDDIIRACGVFTRTRRAVGGRPAPANALSAIFALRGFAYVRKGEIDLAIEHYDEAARLYPKSGFVFHGRAIALVHNRQYDRAIVDYSKAISLNKGGALVESYVNRGEIYTQKQDLRRALSDFNEAIRIQPKYANAYRSRGLVHIALGDMERANADYKMAGQLDPASRQKFEEEKELEMGWVTYLKGIQSENDYANWSGPPLDLFVRSSIRSGDEAATPAPAIATPAPAKASCDIAAVHWTSTESIGTLAAFEDHFARFPDCAFAGLAKARIAALQQGGAKSKTCPAGQSLDADGDCVSPRKKPERKSTAVRSAPARTSSGSAPLPDNSVQQIPTLINRAIQSIQTGQ